VFVTRRRFLGSVLLVAVSLGTAALIEACYECFGLDGTLQLGPRAIGLTVMAVVCGGVALLIFAKSCFRSDSVLERARLRRDLFAKLPFSGTGIRFTALVAMLQLFGMCLVQFGDSAPIAGQDLLGWGTSLMLVLLGAVVVRCVLRLMPHLAPLIAFILLGIPARRRAARRMAFVRPRPMAGCATCPRVMFKRPPPHWLHA
jgi:hypothetical protein